LCALRLADRLRTVEFTSHRRACRAAAYVPVRERLAVIQVYLIILNKQ
jgi:hypothetical protein